MAEHLFLAEILDKLLAVYRLLVELGEKKQELLRQGEINGLESIIEQEEQLIVLAGKLDAKIRTLQEELCEQFGLTKGTTLNQLISYLKDEEVETLKEEIIEVANKLNRVNKINTRLIKNALDYTRYSLEKMTGEDKQTYNRKLADEKWDQILKSTIDRKV